MGSIVAIHPHNQANPMSSSAGSGTPATVASTISANDFLTLLVTEMKNQDPTAQTDPNEYINQLVQVNSLEQLIEINENLTTALDGADSASGQAVGATPGASATVTRQAAPPISDSQSATSLSALQSHRVTTGNLGVPQPVPAAQRVAQALSGR